MCSTLLTTCEDETVFSSCIKYTQISPSFSDVLDTKPLNSWPLSEYNWRESCCSLFGSHVCLFAASWSDWWKSFGMWCLKMGALIHWRCVKQKKHFSFSNCEDYECDVNTGWGLDLVHYPCSALPVGLIHLTCSTVFLLSLFPQFFARLSSVC